MRRKHRARRSDLEIDVLRSKVWIECESSCVRLQEQLEWQGKAPQTVLAAFCCEETRLDDGIISTGSTKGSAALAGLQQSTSADKAEDVPQQLRRKLGEQQHADDARPRAHTRPPFRFSWGWL